MMMIRNLNDTRSNGTQAYETRCFFAPFLKLNIVLSKDIEKVNGYITRQFYLAAGLHERKRKGKKRKEEKDEVIKKHKSR